MAYLMIVDDDEDFAQAVSLALTGAGHEVKHELQADEAMKGIAGRKPDLVILDVMFPENPASGFETARSIAKAYPGATSIPVLMVTAVNASFPLGFSSQDIDTEWLPVADFIEKPVSMDVLQEKVAALLNKASEGNE